MVAGDCSGGGDGVDILQMEILDDKIQKTGIKVVLQGGFPPLNFGAWL
jgi:hypothetical protein